MLLTDTAIWMKEKPGETYLCTSHYHFARGLVNSLSLLIGDEHGVIPVCAYDEDIVTTEQLEQTTEHLIVGRMVMKW